MLHDIFISYSRKDQPQIRALVEVLKAQHWSVWYDDNLVPGAPLQEIEEAMDACRCAVVLWSSSSVASPWVFGEAEKARKRNKLVSVLLEEVEPPVPHNGYAYVDLNGFKSGSSHPGIGHLIRGIRAKIENAIEVEPAPEDDASKVTLTYMDLLRQRIRNGNTSISPERPYNWEGWSIAGNIHGTDFDEAARERMVRGSECLLHDPFLKKHRQDLGTNVLEIGPFFNPLLTPERFPGKNIFFWENEHPVLDWIETKLGNSCYPVYCNLGSRDGGILTKLYSATRGQFARLSQKEGKEQKPVFDSVVASHVLNYVDYEQLLLMLRIFIRKGTLLFINNVVDYGLPKHFSDKRPKSIGDTIGTLEELGFRILDKQIQPTEKARGNERLLIAAILES